MNHIISAVFLLPQVAFSLSYESHLEVQKLLQDAYRLSQANDFQGAIKLSNEAWTADPNKERNRYAMEMLASCYMTIGDFPHSVEWYGKVIDSYAESDDPRGYDSHIRMGLSLTRLGLYDDTLKCYETAFRIFPNVTSKNNIAWITATAPVLSKRDSLRAVNLAREVIEETKENNASYLDTYAAALAEAGRFEDAIEAQKKAVKLIGQDKAFDYTVRIKLYERKIKYRLDITIEKALEMLSNNAMKM